MVLFTICSVFLLIVYTLFLKDIIFYWNAGSNICKSQPDLSYESVSIIVAGKDESNHVEDCLISLLNQNYPKDRYEIIFIDDNSSDDTYTIANKLSCNNLKVIQSKIHLGKKGALSYGISIAKNELLLLTDADSFPKENWIKSMIHTLISDDYDVVAGTIQYKTDFTHLGSFQYFDALNNMALTNYGISTDRFHIANGANLMYKRCVYEKIDGSKLHAEIASGDDVFMVQYAALYDFKIGFNHDQDAIVYTTPEYTWSNLLEQRKRWATKNSRYPEAGLKPIQMVVFLLALCIILMLFFGLFFHPFVPLIGLLILLFKHMIDRKYLYKIREFFPETQKRSLSISLSFVYLAYILYTGYHAVFPSAYIWKGRKVK